MLRSILGFLVAVASPASELQGIEYHSPQSLIPDTERQVLYVGETGLRRVVVWDPTAGKVRRTFPLRHSPGGLALDPGGEWLYITSHSPAGQVDFLELESGRVKRSVQVGHTPGPVIVSPDGRWLYVGCRHDRQVVVIDLSRHRITQRIPTPHEPVALALSGEGNSLWVANLLPTGPSDAEVVSAEVMMVQLNERGKTLSLPLPNGSTALRDLCLSPDGRFLYVTHLLSRFPIPTTQLERGWVITNAVSIIDVSNRKVLNTVLLDEVDRGAANPWGITCSDDGKWLFVALAGTSEICRIDRTALHDRLQMASRGERVTPVSHMASQVPNDLGFLTGIRQRIPLFGVGPRGLVWLNGRIYSTEFFSDSLAQVSRAELARPAARSLPLDPVRPMSVIRRGEMLFHDARSCFQQWLSCASCHPDKGGADGLNWDLMNDGIGNPKNTKSLLLAHQTPPMTVTGVRPNLARSVRAGFHHIELMKLSEEDAISVEEYLKSLRPVPSPHLVDGELSASARRGARLFQLARCADCHPPPLFTNLKSWDVGTGWGRDEGQSFDTPTLIEVWRSAPYLYDGRARNLRDVLTTFNPSDEHGVTSNLNESQLDDLAAYVLSLGPITRKLP